MEMTDALRAEMATDLSRALIGNIETILEALEQHNGEMNQLFAKLDVKPLSLERVMVSGLTLTNSARTLLALLESE